jgi:methyl-accepting chemotaxis protein
METLLIIFIVVTAVAVVIQMGVLVALFATVRKSSARMEALAAEIKARAIPTLDTAQTMLTTYRPKLGLIIDNLTETSAAVKEQVTRLEQPVGEVIERTRQQVLRVDELVTQTLDRVENATDAVQNSVSIPLRQATGILQGISVGLSTLFGRGVHNQVRRTASAPKDEMFI